MENLINLHSPEEVLSWISELLEYKSSQGQFIWKVFRAGNAKIGDIAGSINSQGYIHIKLKGITFKVHRLVWLMEHKEWPKGFIDHLDQNKTNNHISNLRDVDKSTNNFNIKVKENNTSGHPGVYWYAASGKWRAQIGGSKNRKYLGTFNTLEEAITARELAVKEQNIYIHKETK